MHFKNMKKFCIRKFEFEILIIAIILYILFLLAS